MRFAHLLILASCLMLVGCRDADWGTATGKVSLDDSPMKKGMVTFEPVGGGATAFAQITGDGSFKAMTGTKEGLKVGDYGVTVIDQEIPDYGQVAKILTPAKYAAAATSDLKATIRPGSNTFDFVLKK